MMNTSMTRAYKGHPTDQVHQKGVVSTLEAPCYIKPNMTKVCFSHSSSSYLDEIHL